MRVRHGVVGALACALLAVGASAQPSPEKPETPTARNVVDLGEIPLFDPDGWYRLTTEWRGDDWSLDVYVKDDEKDYNRLLLNETGDYSGQYWNITPTDGGYFRLTNMYKPGTSLDVLNDDDDDTPVLSETGDYLGQDWKITPWGDGYFRLTNRWQGDGLSLDIINDEHQRKLILAPTGNYLGQSWKFTRIGGGAGGACTWKTSDIIDPRIDVGAQYSLMRKMGAGPPASRDASAMLGAVKRGELAGILLPPRRAVSERGQRMSPPRGWWQMLLAGARATCLHEPAGEPPLLVYRQGQTEDAIDVALSEGWAECGLPTPDPPCGYVVDRHKPPPPSNDDDATGTSSLTVEVVRHDGSHPSDAIVRISGAAGRTRPAPGGTVRMTRLPEGAYTVRASAIRPGGLLELGFGQVSLAQGASRSISVTVGDPPPFEGSKLLEAEGEEMRAGLNMDYEMRREVEEAALAEARRKVDARVSAEKARVIAEANAKGETVRFTETRSEAILSKDWEDEGTDVVGDDVPIVLVHGNYRVKAIARCNLEWHP